MLSKFQAKASFKSSLLVFASLCASDAQSQARPRTFFQASRALAMGDAYTAYDTGFEAVYYNPAGVAKRNKAQLKVFDMEAVASSNTYSLIKNSYSNLGNMSALIDEVANSAGSPYSLGFNFLPQFMVRNFSFGFIGRNYTEAYVHPISGNLDFYAFNDVGFFTQFGAAFFGGILKIGVGVKIIDRAEINKSYTQAEYSSGNLSYSGEWKEGLGTGFDAGVLLVAPVRGLPTLGVAMQDIGNTTLKEHRMLFSSSNAQPGNPPPLLQKINVGLSLQSKHGRGNKIFFAADVKDVTRLSQGSVADHLHAGLEVDIQKTLYMRGGVNQGRYWTAGGGLHIGMSGIEFATYGENIGFNGSRVDDRKFVGRYVYIF